MNAEYRNIDKPTDVLSFPQDDPITLGDIVISIETAERQAITASWPISSELALLGVHGILHLTGYEDDSENGALTMETITRSILKSAAVALPGHSHPFFQRA